MIRDSLDATHIVRALLSIAGLTLSEVEVDAIASGYMDRRSAADSLVNVDLGELR